jgi:hypothetical protein
MKVKLLRKIRRRYSYVLALESYSNPVYPMYPAFDKRKKLRISQYRFEVFEGNSLTQRPMKRLVANLVDRVFDGGFALLNERRMNNRRRRAAEKEYKKYYPCT